MNIDCGAFTLRPFTPADAPSVAELLNDRDIWLNLSDRVPYPYTLEHAHWFIDHVSQKTPLENLAIDVDGRAVGSVGLFRFDGISRVSAEIGYWLGKPYWGRGIMTPAVKAFTKYAAEQFEFSRIFALAYAHNSASHKVLEKAGYVREGFMRQSVIKDGVIHDEYLYAWYADRVAAAKRYGDHRQSGS